MPSDSPGALPVRPSAPPRRDLADLLGRVPGLRPSRDPAGVTVSGCTHDSRAVEPGDLYAARPGARVHGADFATEVVAAGATAVLTDERGAGAPVGGTCRLDRA